NHRPTKVAVYAILARAYLYMGNYAEALKYAEDALSIHDFLYDYNTLYTGVDMVSNLIGMSRTEDKEVLLHKTTSKGNRLNQYMIIDSASFNKLYSDFSFDGTTTNNFDLRRTLRFTGIDASGNITGNKLTYNVTYNTWYKKDGSNSSGADNIPVATPEMYLIRAECN